MCICFLEGAVGYTLYGDYWTLCLHIIHFGDPFSIDLVYDFRESVHPFVICVII